MLTEKEKTLLTHLRSDSRKSLAAISKETNIPISTLFDALKRVESKVISKHVTLVDFSKLGYNLKTIFILNSGKKQELKEFLSQYKSVNTLSSLINGYDFYVECIFKDFREMIDFKEKLESFDIKNMEETFIVEELKKEGFSL